MRFRFTLSHDILGSLEISEPDGWKDAVLKLERDKNFHSLIEYFDGSFIFYGNNGEVNGGIDFIRQVESEYGFDADLNILIEITVDGYTYDTVFTGLLKLEAIQETVDNKIQVPIIRNDFWSKFINRFDTPVDIQSEKSLDNEVIDQFESINLRLSSQKIRQVSHSILSNGYIVGEDWVNEALVDQRWLQLSFDIQTDEIKELYTLPISLNDERPVSNFIAEYGGYYTFDVGIILGLVWSASQNVIDLSDTSEFNFWIQKNDEDPIPFSLIKIDMSGSSGSDDAGYYSINQSFILLPDDSIRIFGKFTVNTVGDFLTRTGFIFYGEDNSAVESGLLFGIGPGTTIDFEGPKDPTYKSFLTITANTVYPESNVFGFLIHDTGGQISDRIISKNESFYSEYLGSGSTIYRQYNQDGCGWKYTLLKGLQLRQYSLIEKPFFQSFKDWWDGANPILNLGLGYEEIDGSEVIRVEEKEHFFDDEVSIYIDNVRDIQRVYDQERIFKTVKIGYKQWQSENISGIDDPQTKHTYASRLKKSGTDITLESEFIAASLAIETTRRTTREKSADYKFDNETFIISINPIPIDVSPETSPDVNDYSPELDENFTSISNLLNSETRYNSRITPARNMIRWLPYLSSGLQSYLDSVFKFTSGEGNYDMISDMSNTSDGCDEYKLPISEKQDIPVYNDPTHLALLYEINIPLEWDKYKNIRDNRKKAIAISQTSADHVKFFIKELAYDVTKSVAKVTAWAKEFMPIEVIEYTPAMIRCSPRTEYHLTVDNTSITVDSTEITVDQTEYTI